MNVTNNPILTMINVTVTDDQKEQAKEAWHTIETAIWDFFKDRILPFLVDVILPFLVDVACGIWNLIFLKLWHKLEGIADYCTTSIVPWIMAFCVETMNYVNNILHHFAVKITNISGDITVGIEGNIDHQYLDWNKTNVSNNDFTARHLLQIPHSMGFWTCVGWTVIVLFGLGLLYLDLLDTFLGYASAFNPLGPLIQFYRLWLRRRVVIREPLPGQPRVIPNGILINGLTVADCTVPAVGNNGNIHTYHQAMHAPSAAPRNQKRLIPTRAEALAGDYPDEPGVQGFRPLRPADENAIYAGAVATVNVALTPEQGLSLLRGVVAFHVHRVRNTGVNQGTVGALNPNLCVTHSAYNSLHVGYNRALNHPLVIQMLDDLYPIAQDFHLIILAANMTAVTNRYNRMKNRHKAVVDAPGYFNRTEHWTR